MLPSCLMNNNTPEPYNLGFSSEHSPTRRPEQHDWYTLQTGKEVLPLDSRLREMALVNADVADRLRMAYLKEEWSLHQFWRANKAWEMGTPEHRSQHGQTQEAITDELYRRLAERQNNDGK